MKSLSEFGFIRKGSFYKLNPLADIYKENKWTTNYLAANGSIERTFELTAGNLSTMTVMGECKSGFLALLICQEEITKEINLTNKKEENIDLKDLSPGLVKMIITAKAVKRMKTTIFWLD